MHMNIKEEQKGKMNLPSNAFQRLLASSIGEGRGFGTVIEDMETSLSLSLSM